MAVNPGAYGQQIWDFLVAWLGNEYGAAGAMGNLYAESGLLPFRKQWDFDYPDYTASHQYTADVDNGTIPKSQFITDEIGYGLAQWTLESRKDGLYEQHKFWAVSIGNLNMQLRYLKQEIETSYPSTYNALVNATSVRGASDVFLTDFERPADQSEPVKVERAGYGQEFYDLYHGGSPQPPIPTRRKGKWIYYMKRRMIPNMYYRKGRK